MIDAMTNTPSLPPAGARAIELIKNEHRALARMLGAMQALIARYRDAGGELNFELFDAMLRYIENVPDRLHHPKEDQVLFPALVRRASEGKKLVGELERDHARGEPMITALRGAFHAFSYGTVNGLNQLATAVDEFAEFYWDHMSREEQQLLPLAVAHLTPADWQRVESAFGDNTDPLFGAKLADDYRQLYQAIVELTPSPLKSYLEAAAPGAGG
jgi:hemerythrin-like domain-containing protein